ncbi:antimicrobial peptide THP1-like [Vidua chalybeata]|uniref:antimicrobial peptide THP1-like n=1 Tax=Vidua chalybeata TaxID=81927 RepID=UPI0023A7FA98|nr:antimicrobial peptide THP1-like [Vidua chalybeata]
MKAFPSKVWRDFSISHHFRLSVAAKLCEDPGEAAAMKILFLLFPLILLLVQGAAGSPARCRRRGGFCSFDGCSSSSKPIGRCSAVSVCCKSRWV